MADGFSGFADGPSAPPWRFVAVRGGAILNEDTFETSMMGWTTLFTPAASARTYGGPVRIKRSGTPVLALRLMHTVNAEAMAIKRMSNLLGDGRYLIEFMCAMEILNLDLQYPRWFSFGLDYAKADGTRRFMEVRFLNYDEAGAAQANKWQLNLGGGSVVDVTGGSYTWQNNENKILPVYVAIEVDTDSGKYRGLRIDNSIRVGSLANSPDGSLEALGAVASSSLVTFSRGLNPFFSIVNRSTGTKTKGQMNLIWQRTTFLGA